MAQAILRFTSEEGRRVAAKCGYPCERAKRIAICTVLWLVAAFAFLTVEASLAVGLFWSGIQLAAAQMVMGLTLLPAYLATRSLWRKCMAMLLPTDFDRLAEA